MIQDPLKWTVILKKTKTGLAPDNAQRTGNAKEREPVTLFIKNVRVMTNVQLKCSQIKTWTS